MRQFAVAPGADLDLVARLGTIGRDRKALIAGYHQLHRTIEAPRDAGDDGGTQRHRAFEPNAPPT